VLAADFAFEVVGFVSRAVVAAAAVAVVEGFAFAVAVAVDFALQAAAVADSAVVVQVLPAVQTCSHPIRRALFHCVCVVV